MEKKLEHWLSGRNLSKKTLKMLVKEKLVTTEVLSLLREDDIQVLSQKHSLSMGETVHLREVRDAVIRGEYGGRLVSRISAGTAGVREDGVEEGQPKRGEMDSAPDVSTYLASLVLYQEMWNRGKYHYPVSMEPPNIIILTELYRHDERLTLLITDS